MFLDRHARAVVAYPYHGACPSACASDSEMLCAGRGMDDGILDQIGEKLDQQLDDRRG